MNWADFFVRQIFFSEKPLAWSTVVSLIRAFVDISAVVEGSEEFLCAALMHITRRPHEDVV